MQAHTSVYIFYHTPFVSFYSMIQVKNLTYSYNRKKTLFNGLNLELHPGKTYGLLGKNGAGKSSLIKNIAGFLFPTKGSCKVNGYESKRRETKFLEQLFFIPEECELPRLTVPAFIEIYAPFYPSFNKEQFIHYLKIFNVSEDSHLHKLSFGQKKKAYIAFALATNTDVLIMDEPTNGLDIPSKLQFRNMVATAGRENKITIMSTHQVHDLDDIINTVIIIDNSEVLLYADKEDICRKFYFNTGALADKTNVIYAEQTPQGIVSILPNKNMQTSYLDLEILFNATLHLRHGLMSVTE